MGQISKLGFVDRKLGANMPGQQTTRIVYNTIPAVASTTLEFFKNFQGLTLGQTNLTTNKLDSSESMVIKTITLYNIAYGGAKPNIDNQNANMEYGSYLSVFVGNQEVIKRLPLHLNATGQAYDRLHAAAGTPLFSPGITPATEGQFDLPLEIRLLTDIVIPPQTSFYVRVETAGVGIISGSSTCVLSGYGKIFSAGSSF